MWVVSIAALGVISVTIILMTVLEMQNRIRKNTGAYRIMEALGIFVPFAVILGEFAYWRTDTFKETVIVMISFWICIALVCVFIKRWRTKRYNYIMFTGTVLGCSVLIHYITPYMIADLDRQMIVLMGAVLGSSMINNKYKGRLIIVGMIVSFVLAASVEYLEIFDTKTKVENISIDYAESLGYDITGDDQVVIWGKAARNEPIHLSIVRRDAKQDRAFTRELRLVYFKGQTGDGSSF